MNRPLHVLVVGDDPRLKEECAAALAALGEGSPVIYDVSDLRQAVGVARSRRPALTIVQLTADLQPIRTLAEELHRATPDARLIGAFQPEIFSGDISESAMLIEALRAGVCDFLRRPISTTDVAALVDRLLREPAAVDDRHGRVVAFASNKGGVGKSTLSVNAAVAVARRHAGRTLLIDASLQSGNCAALLDLQPSLSLTDAARQLSRLDERLLQQLTTPHDSGLELLAAPADAIEGAEVTDEVLSRVLCLARRAYDFVVVDTFPLFDRNVMAVLDHTDDVFVVLENVVPTLLGIQKFLKLLESLGVTAERQRLVLNRYARRYGGLLPHDAEEHLSRKLDYVIPFERRLPLAANLGRPFVLSGARFSPALREIQRLAEEIERRRLAPVAHALPQRPGDQASGNGVAVAREIAGATGDHSNHLSSI